MKQKINVKNYFIAVFLSFITFGCVNDDVLKNANYTNGYKKTYLKLEDLQKVKPKAAIQI